MDTQVSAVVAHVRQEIGEIPDTWPGGWPDDVELALIDAVFSIQARYGSREKLTGVYGVVHRWQCHRDGHADDLRRLADADPAELQAVLANNSVISGRPKYEVVKEAAQRLVSAELVTASDVRGDVEAARSAYTGVHGLGDITWSYLRMLLGAPGFKPDVWVLRFLADAVGQPVEPKLAFQLLEGAAGVLDVDATQLDHAIWSHQRSQG